MYARLLVIALAIIKLSYKSTEFKLEEVYIFLQITCFNCSTSLFQIAVSLFADNIQTILLITLKLGSHLS